MLMNIVGSNNVVTAGQGSTYPFTWDTDVSKDMAFKRVAGSSAVAAIGNSIYTNLGGLQTCYLYKYLGEETGNRLVMVPTDATDTTGDLLAVGGGGGTPDDDDDQAYNFLDGIRDGTWWEDGR